MKSNGWTPGRGLRARRVAAGRMERLPCGCRDPLTDRHRCDGDTSEHTATAYLHAVTHLRDHGLLAAPDVPAMQQLWRRGPAERRLVAEIASAWELVA